MLRNIGGRRWLHASPHSVVAFDLPPTFRLVMENFLEHSAHSVAFSSHSGGLIPSWSGVGDVHEAMVLSLTSTTSQRQNRANTSFSRPLDILNFTFPTTKGIMSSGRRKQGRHGKPAPGTEPQPPQLQSPKPTTTASEPTEPATTEPAAAASGADAAAPATPSAASPERPVSASSAPRGLQVESLPRLPKWRPQPRAVRVSGHDELAGTYQEAECDVPGRCVYVRQTDTPDDSASFGHSILEAWVQPSRAAPMLLFFHRAAWWFGPRLWVPEAAIAFTPDLV